MPRPKSNALAELTSWMEQAHQLQSALEVLDSRVAPAGAKAKRPRSAHGKKAKPQPQTDSEVH